MTMLFDEKARKTLVDNFNKSDYEYNGTPIKDMTIKREDAKEIFSKVKYRDPRDTIYMKKHKGEKLPYSIYDFSTNESIESAFEVDVNRKYQAPMYVQAENKRKDRRSGGLEK